MIYQFLKSLFSTKTALRLINFTKLSFFSNLSKMLRFLQKLETRNVSFYIVHLFFSIKSRETSRIHLAPSSIFSTITNPIVPEPQKSKKLKFRIYSKKVLLKYNLPDNVPLTLLLEHIKMLFNKFGLLFQKVRKV